jgi:hypothetical protein
MEFLHSLREGGIPPFAWRRVCRVQKPVALSLAPKSTVARLIGSSFFSASTTPSALSLSDFRSKCKNGIASLHYDLKIAGRWQTRPGPLAERSAEGSGRSVLRAGYARLTLGFGKSHGDDAKRAAITSSAHIRFVVTNF